MTDATDEHAYCSGGDISVVVSPQVKVFHASMQSFAGVQKERGWKVPPAKPKSAHARPNIKPMSIPPKILRIEID